MRNERNATGGQAQKETERESEKGRDKDFG